MVGQTSCCKQLALRTLDENLLNRDSTCIKFRTWGLPFSLWHTSTEWPNAQCYLSYIHPGHRTSNPKYEILSCSHAKKPSKSGVNQAMRRHESLWVERNVSKYAPPPQIVIKTCTILKTIHLEKMSKVLLLLVRDCGICGHDWRAARCQMLSIAGTEGRPVSYEISYTCNRTQVWIKTCKTSILQ